MPATEYFEIISESRIWEATQTSTEETFVITFQLLESGDEDYVPPTFSQATFLGDDEDVLALETAYSIIPLARWAPNGNGDPLLLILERLKVSQVDNYGWWRAEFNYKYDDASPTGGSQEPDPEQETMSYIKIGFSAGGGTRTLLKSKEVISTVSNTVDPRPLPSAEMRQLIGATQDTVEGTEIPTGGLTLRVTAYYKPSVVRTNTFLNRLAEFMSEISVNSGIFLGFAAGEVRLDTIEGEATIVDVVPITFTFNVKKNITDRADPDFPNLTAKGHEVLDYRFIESEDDTALMIAQKPQYRIVHRVFDEKDFNTLGFPTTLGDIES